MRTPQRTILLTTASVMISSLLSLGALEIALRVYHQFGVWREWRALPPVAERALIPSPDPELIFEWNPGWSKQAFTLNSLGMADREVALEKSADVFRIAFIGDSITANFEHRPRPEIYLNVLGSRLEQEARGGARFEVLNFGVNAYSLLQSVRALEVRAARFAPDLVIAQLCLNDPYPSSTPYALATPNGPSRLWNFLYRRLARDRFWGWAYIEANYDETGIANVRRGIARLAELGREGPPILAVLFPYFYAPAYEQWGFERFHEIYRQAAREAGLPLLDLYDPLQRAGLISAAPFPADAIHPGREVHALAAVAIEARLDELRLLPPVEGLRTAGRGAPDERLPPRPDSGR